MPEKSGPDQSSLELRDAGPANWEAFVELMGPKKGGSGGCWCMLWRLDRKAFDAGKGDANRDAMKALFDREPPGILAFDGDRAVGWCAIAPRPAYPYLDRSRLFKPLDDLAVWSVSCLTVAKSHRRQGLSVTLLEGAADFVRRRGGPAVEGYPVDPAVPNYPAVYAWTGLAESFRRAGYEEVARPSETRPIMRRMLA